MQRLQSLLGLPVLEIQTGLQIGEVIEVVLDITKASICGIIIPGESCLAEKRGIVFEDLFSIGRDAVMVENRRVIRECKEFTAASYYLRDFFEKQIFTETGLHLGSLADIAFDSTTGEIKAYEISDSLLTDLLYGRMIMPLPQAQTVGQDKLIVPESMAKLLQIEPVSE